MDLKYNIKHTRRGKVSIVSIFSLFQNRKFFFFLKENRNLNTLVPPFNQYIYITKTSDLNLIDINKFVFTKTLDLDLDLDLGLDLLVVVK